MAAPQTNKGATSYFQNHYITSKHQGSTSYWQSYYTSSTQRLYLLQTKALPPFYKVTTYPSILNTPKLYFQFLTSLLHAPNFNPSSLQTLVISDEPTNTSPMSKAATSPTNTVTTITFSLLVSARLCWKLSWPVTRGGRAILSRFPLDPTGFLWFPNNEYSLLLLLTAIMLAVLPKPVEFSFSPPSPLPTNPMQHLRCDWLCPHSLYCALAGQHRWNQFEEGHGDIASRGT